MYRSFSQRKATGVTLIETIMVIVLLAAAAVTSLVLLDGQWLAKRNVTDVTREVAETLNAARTNAITSRSTFRIRRMRRNGTEQLQITENAGPFGQAKTRTIELGSDVRLQGTPREIRFDPTGTASRALRWRITQSRTAGTVRVVRNTGQVTQRLP